MTPAALAAHIGTCLDEDQVDYAIGGALALTAFAIVRNTDDVDISVFASTAELPRVFDALERAGVMIDRADATAAVSRIGMFTGRSGRTLVDIFVGDHPHFHAMRARRVQLTFPSGQKCWFVSAEDLCVLKLLFGRAKDLVDLERLFAAVPTLDLDYITGWIDQLPAASAKRALFDDLCRRFRP